MKLPHLSKQIVVTLVTLGAATEIVRAAAVVTVAISTEGRFLEDFAGSPLTKGSNNTTNGDGAAVQVGYYQNSSAGNPFGDGNESTFTTLIGQGSVLGISLSVGDTWENGAGDGEIYKDVEVSGRTTGGTTDPAFPAPGIPLVMRFFSATSLTGSTRYEAVSSTAWGWVNPLAVGIARVEMNFELGLLTSKNNQPIAAPGTNIRTTAPNPLFIPEPSCLLLLSIAACVSMGRRIRK